MFLFVFDYKFMFERQKHPLLPIFCALGLVVGIGISMIPWGDPGGVHGAGFPAPTKIDGLPEDSPSGLSAFSDLGALAIFLNAGLAIFACLVLWALFQLILKLRQ